MAESEVEVKHHLENGEDEGNLEKAEEEEDEVKEGGVSEERNEDERESEEDEVEEEDKEEKIRVKKRKCLRRRKTKICFDCEGEDEDETEEDEDEEEEIEEGEEGESEKEEDKLSDISSYDPSVLSAVSFIWANEVYEFEELCDPRMVLTVDQKPDKHVSPKEVLDESGKYRYLRACKALNVAPMTRIMRLLYTDELDLSFCNVNSKDIKAICAALEVNSAVGKLIMKYNKLVLDDCHCIGFVLEENEMLYHLDFTGCRIGPKGLEKLIVHLPHNEYVTDLNLSKCQIGDEGMKYLAYVLTKNNSIVKLDISYNNLGEESGDLFPLVFKLNTALTDLNLRYNNLFYPSTMKNFFRALTFNTSVERLDLSWNGMSDVSLGTYIGSFLKGSRSIRYLDLSDNRFEGQAVMEIRKGLSKSRTLRELRIGKNPMSCEDLETILAGAKTSKLQCLDLEDLWVKKSFVKALTKIQQEKNIKVNYAGVFKNYEIIGPDYPKLILQRAQFEAMKPKAAKKRRDFGHLMWSLGDEPMTKEDFMISVKKFKAKINKELYPELLKQFTIPKVQLIDVVAMRQKYLSIFPDSRPPPPKAKGKKGKAADEEALLDEAQTEVGEEFEDFTELEDEEGSELEDFTELEDEEGREFEDFEGEGESELVTGMDEGLSGDAEDEEEEETMEEEEGKKAE